MILQSLDLESFIVSRQVNQFLQAMASWQNKTIGQFYEKIRNKVFYCKAVWAHIVQELCEQNLNALSAFIRYFWESPSLDNCAVLVGRDQQRRPGLRLHYCGNVKTDKLQHRLILPLWPVPGSAQNIVISNSVTILIFPNKPD